LSSAENVQAENVQAAQRIWFFFLGLLLAGNELQKAEQKFEKNPYFSKNVKEIIFFFTNIILF
jgi:hypothetical protein